LVSPFSLLLMKTIASRGPLQGGTQESSEVLD
jgi:hypothetical protein